MSRISLGHFYGLFIVYDSNSNSNSYSYFCLRFDSNFGHVKLRVDWFGWIG